MNGLKKAVIIVILAGIPIVLTVVLLIGPCIISIITLLLKSLM